MSNHVKIWFSGDLLLDGDFGGFYCRGGLSPMCLGFGANNSLVAEKWMPNVLVRACDF